MKTNKADKLATSRRIWMVWWLICVSILVLYLPHLTTNPPIYQDEVQITDFGRTFFQPESDWAVSWNVGESIPVLPLSYLGAAIKELAFQIDTSTIFYARLCSLLAALLAATVSLGWLLSRKVIPLVALALAVAFLLDPMFVMSYRNGRVDGLAFAACLGACWCLRLAASRLAEDKSPILFVAIAGGLLALSLFLWLSAPFLAPLVLLEFFCFLRLIHNRHKADQRFAWLQPGLIFAGSGLAVLTILLLPPLLNLELYVQGLASLSLVQSRAAAVTIPIYDLFIIHDPVIALLVILSLAIRRETGLILAIIVVLLMMYQTMVYPARAIYLLPYFMAVIAGASQICFSEQKSWIRRSVMRWGLLFLIVINTGGAAVLRPVISQQQAHLYKPDRHFEEFQSVIGGGPKRVLLEEWSAYYAARKLGWKVYRSGSPVKREEYLEFIQTMDYVVLRVNPLYTTTRDLMAETDFEQLENIDFPQQESRVIGMGIFRLPVPAGGYSSLEIYRNPGIEVRSPVSN